MCIFAHMSRDLKMEEQGRHESDLRSIPSIDEDDPCANECASPLHCAFWPHEPRRANEDSCHIAPWEARPTSQQRAPHIQAPLHVGNRGIDTVRRAALHRRMQPRCPHRNPTRQDRARPAYRQRCQRQESRSFREKPSCGDPCHRPRERRPLPAHRFRPTGSPSSICRRRFFPAARRRGLPESERAPPQRFGAIRKKLPEQACHGRFSQPNRAPEQARLRFPPNQPW